MSWYRKPKPADQVAPPGPCVICGATGSVELSGATAPELHSATSNPYWICRGCADERRGDAVSN